LAAAGGCASPAKYIEKKGDTGIVSIPNNSDSWPSYNKRAAHELIQKHVGMHYEIIEERDVVVGQSTTNNQQVNTEQTPGRFPFLAPNEKQTVTNNTTSRDLTEWRIWYKRIDPPRPGINGGAPLPGGDFTPAGAQQPANPMSPSVLPAGGPVPRYTSGGTGSHSIPPSTRTPGAFTGRQ
jgi:hypothetical protein